jgi:phage terminase large subunit
MRWTDFTFHFYNGSYIEFFGLEDADKAHGPGRDILFINEANFIPKAVYDQLAMRTTGKILLDLNPSEFNSWVYLIAEDPANINIHSTYKDNLANLSEQQVAFIESYQHLPDKFMWQVYGLGLRGASEEIIYRGWQLVDEMPGKGEVVYGLDFGFVHPTALIAVEFYEGDAYIDEAIYQSGLTKPELTELIKGIIKGRAKIYADSSEADSIEELYRNGLNIHKANKDVWSGIITVKSVRLFITRRSKNVIREIQGYKWKKDKNDNILEEPVKEGDDAMDAARYAIHTHLAKPKMNYFAL